MTEQRMKQRMKRRENLYLSLVCAYTKCQKAIKIGDRVVTVPGYRSRTRIYHEKCHEKVMEGAV